MIQLLFLGLAALGYTALAQNPCGSSEWRYSPHTGKCYRLYQEKIGWTAGEFKCYFQGAHHPSIHNPADNQFVSELARQAGIVWLGAAQYGNSVDYVYSDKTPFNFENWEIGTRPPVNRGRKCIKVDGNTGKWVQSCCKVPASLICQKNAAFLPGPIVEEISEADKVAIGKTSNDIRRAKFIRRF
uniref:C-type lectin domain-containing protein n=1 Tax=Acrobeloides nanus TaxID=290746 RepID=A0A914D983_9BILA